MDVDNSGSTTEQQKALNYKTKRVVSFSQFQLWAECKRSWHLKYNCRIKPNDFSLDLIVGKAMHTTIQEWLTVAFKSVKKSEEMDLYKICLDHFNKEYEETKHLSPQTPMELMVAKTVKLEECKEMLKTIKAQRRKHYSTKKYELSDIEFDLKQVVYEDEDMVIEFSGFIDLLLKDKELNEYAIIDFKPSKFGWKYEMKDAIKRGQIVLYSYFLKKLLGPNTQTSAHFHILRKRLRDVNFNTNRFQLYTPPQGTVSEKQIVSLFMKFVEDVKYSVTNKAGEHLFDEKLFPSGNGCLFCKFSSSPLCNFNKKGVIDAKQELFEGGLTSDYKKSVEIQ